MVEEERGRRRGRRKRNTTPLVTLLVKQERELHVSVEESVGIIFFLTFHFIKSILAASLCLLLTESGASRTQEKGSLSHFFPFSSLSWLGLLSI